MNHMSHMTPKIHYKNIFVIHHLKNWNHASAMPCLKSLFSIVNVLIVCYHLEKRDGNLYIYLFQSIVRMQRKYLWYISIKYGFNDINFNLSLVYKCHIYIYIYIYFISFISFKNLNNILLYIDLDLYYLFGIMKWIHLKWKMILILMFNIYIYIYLALNISLYTYTHKRVCVNTILYEYT